MQVETRKRFIVVGMARSGTTVTFQAVQGHPDVRASMDEIRVSPFFTRGLGVFTTSGDNPWERDHGLHLLLDAMTLIPDAPPGKDLLGFGGSVEHPKSARVLANGIKVALENQQDAEQFAEAFRTRTSLRDVYLVRVDRRDLVAQHASLYRAVRSGVWHSFYQVAPALKDAKGPFAIPPEEFERYCRECLAARAVLDRLRESHRVFEIDYERDVDGGDGSVYRRMFEFLSLPPIAPTWMHSTKVSPPVESYVTNARELYEIAARMQDERVS